MDGDTQDTVGSNDLSPVTEPNGQEPTNDSAQTLPQTSSENTEKDGPHNVGESKQKTGQRSIELRIGDAVLNDPVVQTEALQKKPKATRRTPEQKAVDEIRAEQEKVNSRLEAAMLKLAAADRRIIFDGTLKVLHKAMLDAEHSKRDKILAQFNDLLGGKERAALVNYRRAVTAEIAALKTAATAKS